MAALVRWTGRDVRLYVRTCHEIGAACELPLAVLQLFSGLGCAMMLVNGLCNDVQPAPCPVLHRYLTQTLNLIGQILGARALAEWAMFQEGDLHPGEVEARADELDTLDAELDQLAEDMAPWICSQTVTQGISSDRLLEAAVCLTSMGAELIRNVPLQHLGTALSQVRPRVVEIQTRAAADASHLVGGRQSREATG